MLFLVLVCNLYRIGTGTYLLASKFQKSGRNDAKYRLSSVRIPYFLYLVHVESDMCIESKKDTMVPVLILAVYL